MPPAAFAAARNTGGSSNIRRSFPRSPGLGLAFGVLVAAGAVPALAAPLNARITGLSDLPFGTITNFAADSSLAENVCIYSTAPMGGYQLTATGSGTGGAFTLASGGNTLAYEVQWNATAGKTTGTQVMAGTPLTGLNSSATQQTCNSGPASSASLIVILRSAALSSAAPGTYNGTLTLLIAPH